MKMPFADEITLVIARAGGRSCGERGGRDQRATVTAREMPGHQGLIQGIQHWHDLADRYLPQPKTEKEARRKGKGTIGQRKARARTGLRDNDAVGGMV
jgi:hypothetical protein